MPINGNGDALPDKALSLVFNYCFLPTTKGSQLFRSYPFLLGHVCSRWRRVCFATPDIWTRIIIKCNHQLTQCDLTLARTYLSYAGPTLPLTLRVHGRGDDSEFRDDRDAFYYFLNENAARWHDVGFWVFFQTDVVVSISDTIREFPSLTTLRISFPYPQVPPQEFHDTEWKKTSELCEKLQPITFPTVQYLSLDFEDHKNTSSAMVPMLGLWTFPSLTRLTFLLHEESGVRGVAWQLLGTLLERSNEPPLKTLRTSRHSHPSQRMDMKCFLEHVPHLEKADYLYFDYPLWDLLDKRHPDIDCDSLSSFKYAPKLKEIHFETRPFGFGDLVWELRSVLDTRWMDGKGIRKALMRGEGAYSTKKFSDHLDPIFDIRMAEHVRNPGRWTIRWKNGRTVVYPRDDS